MQRGLFSFLSRRKTDHTYAADGLLKNLQDHRAKTYTFALNSDSVLNVRGGTISRWDGWSMTFNDDNDLSELVTDKGVHIKWERNNGRVTRIYNVQTGTNVVEMTYNGNVPSSIKINGEETVFVESGGALTAIQHPDTTQDTFDYTNFASTLTYGPPTYVSVPGTTEQKLQPPHPIGDSTMAHTDRYGVVQNYQWDAWSGALAWDGVWDYSVAKGDLLPQAKEIRLGGSSGPIEVQKPVVFTRPARFRTRRITSEKQTLSYDKSNSVSTFIDIDGVTTKTSKYKSEGKLYSKPYKIEKTDTAGTRTVWQGAYDETNGRMIREIDGRGMATDYAYVNFSGASEFAPAQQTTITDPTSRTTVIKRDTDGNIIEVTAQGVVKKFQYDARGRMEKISNGSNVTIKQFTYNNNDAPLTIEDANQDQITFEYLNRYGESLVTKVTTAENVVAEFTYDGKGNRTTVKTPGSQTWTYAYNGSNLLTSLTDPLTRQTSYEYDARANVKKITDAATHTTELTYNDLDLPATIQDQLTKTSSYEYAADGLLKNLNDNRAKTYTFALNSDRLRKSLQFPDSAKIESTYDGNGNLTNWSAKGASASITLGYDDASRITSQNWTAGSLTGSYTYGYNTSGKLSSISGTVPGAKLTQAFGYDGEGRLSSVGLNGRAATLTYDSNWRLSTLAYPAGFTVTYQYNKDGQIKDILKGTAILASYSYDTAGRLQTRTLGNGVITTYTYTATGRVQSITVADGTSTLWSVTYGYNNLDNRAWATYGGSLGGKGDVFEYNAREELTGAKYGATNPSAGYSGATAPVRTEMLTYDEAGNRTTQTLNGVTSTYAVNDINQYTGITGGTLTAPSYNTRGDIISFDGWGYGYDAAGHLISASNGGTGQSLQWLYDGLGDRVGKTTSSTVETYLSLASHPLETYNALTQQTTTSTIYEPGIDRPLACIEGTTSTVTYYHQDALGSVIGLTDGSGVLSEEYRYDAWGTASVVQNGVVQSAGTVPQSRFLFTGREYDASTALYHYRARAYSPKLGRFAQLDPADFDDGDLNLYRYLENDPLNWIDPIGLGGYTQTGPLSISNDGSPNHSKADDSKYRSQLPGGSPGNTDKPGCVRPYEALEKGVKMGDPATLKVNGKEIPCVVFDSVDKKHAAEHKNKPEVNEAAVKAAGLTYNPGGTNSKGKQYDPYPSIAGKGGAEVPASIFFPTATK